MGGWKARQPCRRQETGGTVGERLRNRGDSGHHAHAWEPMERLITGELLGNVGEPVGESGATSGKVWDLGYVGDLGRGERALKPGNLLDGGAVRNRGAGDVKERLRNGDTLGSRRKA